MRLQPAMKFTNNGNAALMDPMLNAHFETYVDDHCAGAQFAMELLKRMRINEDKLSKGDHR
jgi:hypothetical protein